MAKHKTPPKKSGPQKIKEIATRGPHPLQKENSVREAGEKMRVLETEKFPVAAGDKLVGTVEGKFPDRQAAAFGHDPATTTVGENMTKQKFYCYEHQSIQEAREFMLKNGLQHLSVVDADLHVIGIVSLAELPKDS